MSATTDGARPTTVLRGLHAQTVETLGSRIVRGQYAPGSALSPDELEHEFGISKTVLREALRVLAAKGLVDARQKRGTVVRPRASWSLLDADLLRWQGGEPDPAFLTNLAEVRGIVEPASARLAATRRTDGDLDALRTALQAMADAGSDAAAVVAADLMFHRALLDAAHNELLSRMEVVIEAGLRARDLVVHSGETWPDSVPAHRAVLTAIEASDGDAAAAAVETLLQQATIDVQQVARRSRARKAHR
ncbi:MAG TPA: FCD domain-containing protein [Jatrophihabitans sp.]|nr:FCD domain-containing protein [Jatrophihabitans sp.]